MQAAESRGFRHPVSQAHEKGPIAQMDVEVRGENGDAEQYCRKMKLAAK